MKINPTMLDVICSFSISVKTSETKSHSTSDNSSFGQGYGLLANVLNIAHPVVVNQILEPFIHELIHIFHPDADLDAENELYAIYMNAYNEFAQIE